MEEPGIPLGAAEAEGSGDEGTTMVLEMTIVVTSLEPEVGPFCWLEGTRPSERLGIISPRFCRLLVLEAGTTGGVEGAVEGSWLVIVALRNCRLTLRGK